MIETKTLREVIEQHIRLGRKNGAGWYPVLCKVCNDHGKKGPRAAFRFDDHAVGYNCFNCGHTAVFDPSENKQMTDKMKTVLSSFGIPDEEWKVVVFSAMSTEYSPTAHKAQERKLEPVEVPLPDYFYRLTDDKNDDIAQYAIEYLKQNRLIDWTTYPFYLARITDNPTSKRWYGRLIIPIYKQQKLIFYQGRDLSDTRPQKYLSLNVVRDNVLYGYEFIEENTPDPLYITEGWFDAFLINGVAVFGRKMSDNQIAWLNKSNREKVIVPDRTGKGYDLAEQGLRLGWKVSIPDVGEDVKDITDSVCRYGLLYTKFTLAQHTHSGFEAEVRIKMLLKK